MNADAAEGSQQGDENMLDVDEASVPGAMPAAESEPVPDATEAAVQASQGRQKPSQAQDTMGEEGPEGSTGMDAEESAHLRHGRRMTAADSYIASMVEQGSLAEGGEQFRGNGELESEAIARVRREVRELLQLPEDQVEGQELQAFGYRMWTRCEALTAGVPVLS